MRFAGRVVRAGRFWAVEVPSLFVATQGRTKKDALVMIADAICELVDQPGFEVDVYPGRGEYFEIGARDQARLCAFFLRQRRQMKGVTLAEVAKRLGHKSHNSYARYEQGASVPTITKLSELLRAIDPDQDIVVHESRLGE